MPTLPRDTTPLILSPLSGLENDSAAIIPGQLIVANMSPYKLVSISGINSLRMWKKGASLLWIWMIIGASAHSTFAITTVWTSSTGGNFASSGNWSDGVPSASDDAIFNLANSGSVSLGGANRSLSSLQVQRFEDIAHVSLNLGGGSLSISNRFQIGRWDSFFGSSWKGNVAVNQGSITAGVLYFNNARSTSVENTLTINAGAHVTAAKYESGGGTINVMGGNLTVNDSVYVTTSLYETDEVWNINAGNVHIAGEMRLGDDSSVYLKGGQLEVVSLNIIDQNSGSAAVWSHTNGRLLINGGQFSPSTENYQVKGTVATENPELRLINGGSFTLSGNLAIGTGTSGGKGTLTVSGGTISATSIAINDYSTLNFSGGTLDIKGGELSVRNGTLGGTVSGTGGLTSSCF